jgi:MFS transporter, PHS family, inorganic phosphate transporter
MIKFYYDFIIYLYIILVALLGLVPGYWVSVFLIDRIGRKPIQIIGFTAMTILFTILAGIYTYLKRFF